MIEAVAAAAAKEDLMYHLQRALSEGKIDCQTFLKVGVLLTNQQLRYAQRLIALCLGYTAASTQTVF